MHSLTSLFLSQSYKDTWDDYIRSITGNSFGCWDYIILTASNEHQASGFLSQIEKRKKDDRRSKQRKPDQIPETIEEKLDDLFHKQQQDQADHENESCLFIKGFGYGAI